MEKIITCKKCLMPSSRPRISFENNKICNACVYQSKKKRIDWTLIKKEFLELCNKYNHPLIKIGKDENMSYRALYI